VQEAEDVAYNLAKLNLESVGAQSSGSNVQKELIEAVKRMKDSLYALQQAQQKH
jgi:hypothetical protein